MATVIRAQDKSSVQDRSRSAGPNTLSAVQENFDFFIQWKAFSQADPAPAKVSVRGVTVSVFDGAGQRLCVGLWDKGYVRYERAPVLPIHPALLDAVDAELRTRMTLPGVKTHATPLRRSAIGYQDG